MGESDENISRLKKFLRETKLLAKEVARNWKSDLTAAEAVTEQKRDWQTIPKEVGKQSSLKKDSK